MSIDIEQLQRELAAPDRADLVGHPDLVEIRRRGTRRRRGRRALLGVAGVAAASVVAVVAGQVLGEGSMVELVDEPPASSSGSEEYQHPTTLTPLSQRVLAEVPGAKQVSEWQVVIPGPGAAPGLDEELTPERFTGEPVELDAGWYAGVTAYQRTDFPAWLYDGVQRVEEEEMGDENGRPVGSTDMGIIVEAGSSELACMTPWDWEAGHALAGRCAPALIGRTGGTPYYQWGMGTDDFLEPGSDLELFSTDDYSTGAATTLWIGGLDGTDVARAEFIARDGARVDGQLSTDDLVPGESMFWANLPGELAKVVAYDAAGEVLEDHQVKACSNPVDCEVR